MGSLPLPRGALVVLLAVALSPQAHARPAADVVIVWAPGVDVTPITSVVRDAGAAMIDHSPAREPVPATASLVARGRAAYDGVQFADARRLLDEARALADRTGAAGLSQVELSDLFLYRGLVAAQLGDATGAWDELVAAVIVAPTRLLDPARFPPRVAAELERARASLEGRATARLDVTAASTCSVRIDGIATTTTEVPRLHGPHWVDVRCTDRPSWGTRVELTVDVVITAANPAPARPARDELLIQARTAGAAAFVEIDVDAGIASARLVGVDGRERDRRTVAVTTTLAPLVPALTELLRGPTRVAPTRWYRSRWVWAAGAALLATAIAIPVTALVVRDGAPTSWSAGLEGVPPTWSTR